jgi:hypothetical protein
MDFSSKQKAVPCRVSPRKRKYVVGASFAGMDGGKSKTEYKVGCNGGAYRATDKRAPKSAFEK